MEMPVDINTMSGGVFLALNRLYVHSGGRARSHERLMEANIANAKAISPPEGPDRTISCQVGDGSDIEDWEVYKDEATDKEYYYKRDQDITQWEMPCRIDDRLISPELEAEDQGDWWEGDGPNRIFSFRGEYDELPGVKHLRRVADGEGYESSDARINEFVKDFGGQTGFLKAMSRLQRIVLAVETDLYNDPKRLNTFKDLWASHKRRDQMFRDAPIAEDEAALVAFSAGSAWSDLGVMWLQRGMIRKSVDCYRRAFFWDQGNIAGKRLRWQSETSGGRVGLAVVEFAVL
jgi:hypothetical protein